MKILPNSTRPATAPVIRQHAPRIAEYGQFRSCLRWEFGFSCAFCLLHEADFVEYGVEGTGLTWIEHHVARSEDPSLRDEYGNCFYSCRFCNRARGDNPRIDSAGRRLLEPCTASWAQHFLSVGDMLPPAANDGDASYTHESYDIDDPRKVRLRRDRRERLEQAFRAIAQLPTLIAELTERALRSGDAEGDRLLQAAQSLRTTLLRAIADAKRYAAVPDDHDRMCGCRPRRPPLLPHFLASQLQPHPLE